MPFFFFVINDNDIVAIQSGNGKLLSVIHSLSEWESKRNKAVRILLFFIRFCFVALLSSSYELERYGGNEEKRKEKKRGGPGDVMLNWLVTFFSYRDWEKVNSPAAEQIVPYNSLPKINAQVHQGLLNKLAVLKLNGGLGTTMGCVGPKRWEKRFSIFQRIVILCLLDIANSSCEGKWE